MSESLGGTNFLLYGFIYGFIRLLMEVLQRLWESFCEYVIRVM